MIGVRAGPGLTYPANSMGSFAVAPSLPPGRSPPAAAMISLITCSASSKQLHALACQLRRHERQPCDVAAWPGETFYQSASHRIATDRHHNRDVAGDFPCSQVCLCTCCNDYVNLEPKKIICERLAFPPLIDQCANPPLIEPYTQILAEVIKQLGANEGR